MSATIESPRVEVTREPLTYERHAGRSYFQDRMRAELDGDTRAQERLDRHRDEMTVELRVNPSANTSTLAPPLWLVQDFATAPRPHRKFAEAVQHFDLPAGVHSVNVPRLTTGTTAQPEQDLEAGSDTDIVDASISSTVATIVGFADAAQQLFDQSPPGAHLDYVVFRDLTAAYDAQLELQMLFGSGVGENLLGIANSVPASHQIAYTSGSPSATGIFQPLGQAMAKIGDDRGVEPQLWLLRTARWAWMATSDAASGSGTGALLMADYGEDGQGLLGVKAEWDDAISANLGAGTNQDAIFLTRPDDVMLLESPLSTIATPEPLSGTMEVRFRLMGHAAMINLYPSGHATVTGTGLAVQSGY